MKTRKNTDVINITYKFLLKPDDVHKVHYFPRWLGCKRFLWNVMLYDKISYYRSTGEKLNREVSAYKKDYPFLCEVDSLVLANVKLSLGKAYESFYTGNARFPTYKKKDSVQSFTTNIASTGAANLRYDEKTHLLKLPKIPEPVKVVQHRKIKSGGILKSATVSLEPDGRYYVSLLYEYPKTIYATHIDESKAIGLDMSMEHFYVDSNGNVETLPKFYRRAEAILAREQAKLSKMTKGSNNYKKQKHRIAKLYAKTKHQRSDYLNKLSYSLVQMYDIICIEDLNMKAMSQSLNLGKSVGDMGWGSFVRMLEYKCRRYGKALIKVDRFFPSSKTCRSCGNIHKNLTLSDRLYICPVCGNFIDRDWQAALNILDEGLRIYRAELASAA